MLLNVHMQRASMPRSAPVPLDWVLWSAPLSSHWRVSHGTTGVNGSGQGYLKLLNANIPSSFQAVDTSRYQGRQLPLKK